MKASIYRLFSIDMIKIFLCIERALGIFFPKILDDPRRLKRVPDKKLVVFAHFFSLDTLCTWASIRTPHKYCPYMTRKARGLVEVCLLASRTVTHPTC